MKRGVTGFITKGRQTWASGHAVPASVRLATTRKVTHDRALYVRGSKKTDERGISGIIRGRQQTMAITDILDWQGVACKALTRQGKLENALVEIRAYAEAWADPDAGDAILAVIDRVS